MEESSDSGRDKLTFEELEQEYFKNVSEYQTKAMKICKNEGGEIFKKKVKRFGFHPDLKTEFEKNLQNN